jgi:PAS domain S-box-containing protein
MNLNLRNSYRQKLSRRLLLYILLFSSIVTCCITAGQLYIEYNRDIDAIEEQFTRIGKLFTQPLIQALWYFDENSLRVQLEGIANLRDIEYLELSGEQNVHIAVGQKISKSTVTQELPLLYKGQNFEREIGRLKIVASMTGVYSRLFERMLTILISQGIKTFLVSAFIFYIVHSLIIKHLVFLSSYFKNLETGKPPPVVKLDRTLKSSGDELDQMVHSINSMAERQYSTFEEIEKIVRERTTDLHKTNEQLHHEILDRKLIEQKLSESLESSDEAQRLAHMGHFVRNWQTNEGTWSDGFYHLLGYEPDEIPCTHEEFVSRVHPEDRQTFAEQITASITTGDLLDMEFRILRKDGEIRFIHTRARIKYDSKGQPLSLNGTFVDITERKKAEEENEKLEFQLQQAAKMQAVGTLTGGIAHDFNNIFAAILGFAELIKQDVSTESQIAQDIKDIITSGRRGADLVKHLLAYSKQTGKEKRIIFPHLVTKEAMNMLRATLPTSIDIKEDIDTTCGAVLANPANLQQIVVNLCNNASQSMDEMKGVLEVHLSSREITPKNSPPGSNLASGTYIVLAISDDGCGMDEVTKIRVFDPYFTTKEMGTGAGLGLGLAVVQGIVHDCNGFIQVDSVVGKGSTFSVYLPVSEHSAKKTTTFKNRETGLKDGPKERILVVDDDPLLTTLNERRLTNNGYQVTCSTESQEALEIFLGSPDNFDLIITDQTMPGITGADFAKEVLKVRPEMPIIMCTGHSDTVSEEKALSLGITKFVYKPIVEDELLDAVQYVLDVK